MFIKTVLIVFQVLGCGLLCAMVTTIQDSGVLAFDPPILVRAILGVSGIILTIAGSFYYQRYKESK